LLNGLNEHVIGQADVKKALSVGVYNHYQRLIYKQQAQPDPLSNSLSWPVEPQEKVVLSKANMLVAGPTVSQRFSLGPHLMGVG